MLCGVYLKTLKGRKFKGFMQANNIKVSLIKKKWELHRIALRRFPLGCAVSRFVTGLLIFQQGHKSRAGAADGEWINHAGGRRRRCSR